MKKYIVRYGAIRLHGVFSLNSDAPLFHGTAVIVRTSRGLEAGTVLCEAAERSMAAFSGPIEENRLIRVMTDDDRKQQRQIAVAEKDEFVRTRAVVERMKIPLELIRVEHIFGGERLIVYYTAEGRIDFRELVKKLACEFQTRIEMRQIHGRDVSKLMADVGECGRDACCTGFLEEMRPVVMKLAKLQNPSINPAKISGRCGRLKCCYRFEHDHYAELHSLLPPVGKTVQTPDGPGRVIAQELLAKRVQVDLGPLGFKHFTVEEVRLLATAPVPAPGGQDPPAANTGSRRGGRPPRGHSRPPRREGPRKEHGRDPNKEHGRDPKKKER